jgi:hypothetical protein
MVCFVWIWLLNAPYLDVAIAGEVTTSPIRRVAAAAVLGAIWIVTGARVTTTFLVDVVLVVRGRGAPDTVLVIEKTPNLGLLARLIWMVLLVIVLVWPFSIDQLHKCVLRDLFGAVSVENAEAF